MLAPSPSVGHLIATVPANIANNVSTASALGPGVELAPAPTASGFGTVLSAPTSAPVTGIPTMMMPSGAPSPAQHGTPSPAKHAVSSSQPCLSVIRSVLLLWGKIQQHSEHTLLWKAHVG